MAPPPEYDKEPKAPDKSATNIPSEDSKALYNLVNDLQVISDSKSTNSSANAEVENNKHVETLDDGQLRALLDEAITYKCPKDREGKSSLFKELLEEVEQDEQDEQACAAAARVGCGARGRRAWGAGRGRRALPHSNSLQDLVAALAAEPAPRRRHNHNNSHPPAPAPVSARAIHGGSLPSGVDTSFLLSEEPMRGAVGVGAGGASAGGAGGAGGGAEYVATVRCVNPSPLAERRVSASDVPCPDTDALNRRSKPVFPMYTARATLEIGSGSVCAGRAVTTTTASNQVRSPRPAPSGEGKRRAPRGPRPPTQDHADASFWDHGDSVLKWYRGLEAYGSPVDRIARAVRATEEHIHNQNYDSLQTAASYASAPNSPIRLPKTIINTTRLNLANDKYIPLISDRNAYEAKKYSSDNDHDFKYRILDVKDVEEAMARKSYRERVGQDLVAPSQISYNPQNVRSMSIGPSLPVIVADKHNQNIGISEDRDKSSKDKHNRNTRNRSGRSANVNVVTDKPSAAPPTDKNKPHAQSKTNYQNVEQVRQSSSHTQRQSNLHQTENKKEHSKVDVKKGLRNHDAKSEKDKDLAETVKTKEESQNDVKLVEMAVAEEKSNSKNVKANDETELVKIDVLKENSKNNSELVEMVAPEEKLCSSDPGTKDGTELATEEESQKDAQTFETVVPEDKPCDGETETENDKNLVEMISLQVSSETESSSGFSQFMANQHRLLRAIESYNSDQDKVIDEQNSPEHKSPENDDRSRDNGMPNVEIQTQNPFLVTVERELDPVSKADRSDDKDSETRGTEMVDMKKSVDFKVTDSAPAELPGSASYFLTLYKRLLASPCNVDNKPTVDIKPSDVKPGLEAAAKLPKKKKDKITSRLAKKPHNENSTKKKDIIRNALKMLFFDNVTQSDSPKPGTSGAAAATREVDSAIPFSCITTPEVVASCTTTASTQAAVPVDPKPLQLRSSYRAVASLTGACELRPPTAASHTTLTKPARSMASAFNGVPLPRAGPAFSAAAAVAQAAAEEFKKSLDENGNSVQGFSSPQSGSSQQKKQRRKKSSKNETVIKSHHIDGYQGNKDLNEVLRFIESNEPERPKRHDDKKKRSAERRKDKAGRASSLDDLSRAAPAPARPARPALPAPKPERRSWGDERQAFYYRDPNPEPDPELTDFQTVTKKRKPRRRADEPERSRQRPRAPSPPSPPSPRARSDRSNDSNDDMDSVHSLPALPARAQPPASYADIARTKHNIPDLIESCNYYGEGSPAPARAGPGPADPYPALDAPRRAKPAPAPAARRAAPDVVADRRPPVILLDEAARPHDMDGVTFGFDVNEQLLGGAPRRPRCDLLPPEPAAAPAPAAAVAGATVAAAAPGVAVVAGCLALRYVPPDPPPDDHHLHQIIDYVGTAWEDVVRCGGGKVRYFSE